MSVSNEFQVEVMVELAANYGWTRFGIIASMDDYGKLSTVGSTQKFHHNIQLNIVSYWFYNLYADYRNMLAHDIIY